ncbi:MAG: TerC family protein [Arenicellales bacterium]
MTLEHLWPLAQVILVDLMLAADNAIVIGLAASSVPKEMRQRVIFYGIAAAAVLRIAFALVTVQLLQIIGLVLAGGLLLLWVCWKLWRELRSGSKEDAPNASGTQDTVKSTRQAILQIVIADISMSLDNVLAVAGIAREHPYILVFGLALSVGLMAFGATFFARLLERYHWIAYLGLAIILQVALVMIWEGSHQVMAIAFAD